MNKRLSSKIQVTHRDLKILEHLFKNKVATLKELDQKYFSGHLRSSSGDRLSKLCHFDFLEKKGLFKSDNRLIIVYGLTKKGAELIQDKLPHKMTKHHYVSDSIEHDLTLGEIVEALSQFKMVSQIATESELLSCYGFFDDPQTRPFVLLKSDALIFLRPKEETFYVALEYERSLKGPSRYQEKIREYYNHDEVDAVLYVCETEEILKTVMDLEKTISQNQESKFYFSLRENIQNPERKVTFKTNDNDILTFR